MFKSRKNQCSYIIFLALFLFFNPILVLAQTGSVTLSMKNATLTLIPQHYYKIFFLST